MIIDSYDNKSPAKINVKKNENAVQVDAVIYTFIRQNGIKNICNRFPALII